jgi:succinoglycan biosynthesis protein ExoW
MPPVVGVIIPFYQKECGILARALNSIAHQVARVRIRVIIVDDASPVPAESEVALCPDLSGLEVRIVHQPNGGPGAARNAGLALLPDDTDFVAFLDSDDEWTPHHIERAAVALGAGYDFYFSNFYQPAAKVGAFERAGRINPSEHECLPIGVNLYAFRGDMVHQIVVGNVIGTPCVVFSLAAFPDIRFRTEYRRAGEDYLCWLEFARRGARFAFSSEPEVICGRGVNVFAGAGWGTDGHLARLLDESRYMRAILSEFVSSKQLQRSVRARVRQLRRAIVHALVHDMRCRRRLPLADLLTYARHDPLFPVALPTELLRMAVERGALRIKK